MNITSVKTLYLAEMARSLRTVLQSVVSPRAIHLAVLRGLWFRHWLTHQ